MNPRKIVCQGNRPRACARSEKTGYRLSSLFLTGALWALSALLVSLLVHGCASQRPPKYDVYPALSMGDRLNDPEREKDQASEHWMMSFSQEKGYTLERYQAVTHWRKHFAEELAKMKAGEWPPSLRVLNQTRKDGMEEYNVEEQDAPTPSDARESFHAEFKMEGDPNDNCVECRVERMLLSIDAEHPNLLVGAADLKKGPAPKRYSLPSLVSSDYPVDVSLTPTWNVSPPSETKSAEPGPVIIASTVITAPNKTLFVGPDGKPLLSPDKPDDPRKQKDGKAPPKQTGAKPGQSDDFKSEQCVSLSLSTALNSPAVIDRIDYVSTYLYVQPFPFPPNNDVVLEKEFWRRFFGLNATRDPRVKKEAASSDMRRAIADMRVRIARTETTVLLRDLDFGSLTTKTSDKFTADIGATGSVPPTVSSISPKLGYSSGVDTEAATRLRQQLDQRSTYVDPTGHFLRITQRGMQTVNLAGRFVEHVTLSLPAAQAEIPVLAPVHEGNGKCSYKVRWLAQPLYSRVDALTVSVVVARQATALAKSSKDAFRLDDPKDAAFIVGVTRPYHITLWQQERDVSDVMTWDIFGRGKGLSPNKRMFFTVLDGERPAQLSLVGFTPEERNALFDKIRKAARGNADRPFSFDVKGDNGVCPQIKIGWADDEKDPKQLVGFK